MEKKYEVIYADPPWLYDFSKTNNRKIENQYQTMRLEEIKNLEINSADNAVCYLWATAPKLIEALEVLAVWGFHYKTNMIWNKKQIGMGYWFRGQHELLLVGVKGKFSPPKQELRKPSLYSGKRGKHSQKPDVIRNWIMEWFPNSLKIELFARERYVGWDIMGNEANQFRLL